jgi:hypothetical protein
MPRGGGSSRWGGRFDTTKINSNQVIHRFNVTLSPGYAPNAYFFMDRDDPTTVEMIMLAAS